MGCRVSCGLGVVVVPGFVGLRICRLLEGSWGARSRMIVSLFTATHEPSSGV